MTRAVTTLYLLLALVAAGVCAQSPQTTAPMRVDLVLPLKDYVAALDKLAQRMESAEARELVAISKSLPERWQVTHHGHTVDVSLAWLGQTANEARAYPEQSDLLMGRVRRRVQHMRDEAQLWLESEPGEPDAARERLKAILARSEFGKVRGPNWLDRLRAQIAEWIFDLLEMIFGPSFGFSLIGAILLWSMIALSLIVAVIGGLRALQRRIGAAGQPLKAGKTEKFTWQRWTQQAQASAAQGDYRAAVHHAYWASIYRLEELGAWEIARARTHREYLGMLPQQHDQRANLAGLTRRFEAVWYGRQTATMEDFREATASLERLGCLGSMPATANS